MIYDPSLESSRLKLGENLCLNLRVEGQPNPSLVWSHFPDTQKVEQGLPDVIQTEAKPPEDDGTYKAALKLRKATRDCTGVYRVVATNSQGQAEANFKVTVLTVPSEPLQFTVQQASKASVKLRWLEPADNGGSPLVSYAIERADASNLASSPSTVTYWQSVTHSLSVLEAMSVLEGEERWAAFEVSRLPSGKFMFFRVAAQNKQGIGVFATCEKPVSIGSPHSESLYISIFHKCTLNNLLDAPGVPRNFQGQVDKDGRVQLNWQAPSFDGGAPITKYVVERGHQAGRSGEWTEITLPDSTNTNRLLINMREITFHI
ncbi:unnamed protein product [Protopolystoma xenopodis]|uniref:Fibronectin type-III domain-containing protein n=1 Tax=Protopolystoma xenopodis TaxID=117903 RepID=A0A448XBP0_9PLAT|nr:unnamed protein product [Protopolystoma xenopodis]